jgi:hypothetical protein
MVRTATLSTTQRPTRHRGTTQQGRFGSRGLMTGIGTCFFGKKTLSLQAI